MPTVGRFVHLVPVLLSSALIGSLPYRLSAQLTAGSISGVITDPVGATVSGAQVAIKNEATGSTRQVVSGDIGVFVFANVLPAVYELTASAPGFKRHIRKGITLQVDADARVDVQLEVGELSESVTVAGEAAALVETVNPKVATVVETKQIAELPLNGRQFAQLVLLTPGALPIALGQAATFKLQLGSASYSPVINGARNRHNNFTLDGVENNDPMFNSYAMNPSVDAIQEFSVQSRGEADQNGRSMGGDIVVVTKSGTNAFHGNAWEFLRNDKTAARNFFDPIAPSYKQNQFGATFGGPLRLPHYNGRDRTFFFGYYEGFRSRRSANNITAVPTQAMLGGDFSDSALPRIYDIATTRADPTAAVGYARDPFPGNHIPTNRFDPNAVLTFNRAYPLPNLPGITRNYINTAGQQLNNNQASLRMDQKLGGNNNLFGRISYNDGLSVAPGGIPSVTNRVNNTAWNATASDTQIFRPNLIGHFQFGFNRYTDNQINNPLPADVLKATGWDKLYPGGPPDLLILSLGIADISGAGGSFTPIGPHNTYQAVGDLTWIRGRHTFKTGLTWISLDSFQASPQASIGFTRRPTSNLIDQASTGYGVATFLLGLATDSRRAAGDTSAKLSNHEYHAFLQDEIRLTTKLTASIGLRYSYVQAMKEARDAYSGLDIRTGNYLLAIKNPITGAGPNLRERWVDPVWTNFAPRVGIAYLLNSKTTIRSGFGLYYSFTDMPQFFGDPAGNWPFGFSESVGPLNDFFADATMENPFVRSAGVKLPNSPEGQGGYSLNPHLRTAHSSQWDLSIQRQFSGTLLFETSYVGSNTVKLLQTYRQNQAIPGPGPVQSRRTWPKYDLTIWDDNGPPANYEAVSFKLQKRFAAGLSFLTNYTWAHNLDVFGTDRGGVYGGPQNLLYWRADHASSDADVRHAFVLSGTYELPFGRGKQYLAHGPASFLLGNWQWSNVISVYSGQPVNVLLGFDNASTGYAGAQRPNLVTGTALTPADQNRLNWINPDAFTRPVPFQFGNAGRNLIRAPGTRNWDMALVKNFPVRETKTVQFRAEFFNTFNFVNFGAPVANLSSKDFGTILSARPARIIQFGLKLSF